MYAEDGGNQSGDALLLVHGFLSSNAQWNLNRASLGEKYRLVEVELVGHGSSEAPDDSEAYSLASHLAEFERVRIERGIDKWWVCGQSLGGAIVIQYCLAYPERIHGLIFTNSRAAFGIKRKGVSREKGEPIPVVTSTRDLPIHPINAKRLDEDLKAAMVAAADAMSLHVVDQYTERRHTWRSVDRLPELSMPVLLVNGRWESAFQEFVERASELIRHVEVVSIEGGHAINAEQPEGFNQAVHDFIGRNSAQQA